MGIDLDSPLFHPARIGPFPCASRKHFQDFRGLLPFSAKRKDDGQPEIQDRPSSASPSQVDPVLSVAVVPVEAVAADPVLLDEGTFDLTEEPADEEVSRLIDPEEPNQTKEGSIAVHAHDSPALRTIPLSHDFLKTNTDN